jgi:folate-binding protein YgfZ
LPELLKQAPLLPNDLWLWSEVQSGVATVSAPLVDALVPQMLNYESVGGVNFKKGCYPGQETVAKVFNLGKPPRRLTLLHLDGSMVAMPENGAKVEFDGKEIGFIGTVARHYELGPIALAVLKRNVPIEATLISAGVPATQELIKN